MKTIGDIQNDVIPEAVQALLESSGIHTTQSTTEDMPHFEMIAISGFSGDGFGGALGFAAEHSLFKTAQSKIGGVGSDDWLGEIANQLLGRLKNALLAYNVVANLAIPMVLHGLNLQIRNESMQVYKFQCTPGNGKACVWVDANWDAHQALQKIDAEQHAKAEGATMLF